MARRDESGDADVNDYTSDQKEAIDRLLQNHNYYKILGVTDDATEENLKRQYKKLALQFHPDKNRAPRADEAFKAISNAYQILSEPSKRQHYDKFGESGLHSPEWSSFQSDIPPEELFRMFFETYGRQQKKGMPKEEQPPNKLLGTICGGVLIFFVIFYALSAVLYFTMPNSRKAIQKHHHNSVFHSQQYFESALSLNDLPVLHEPLIGRGDDISRLVESLDFVWPHCVINIYGKAAVGKSSYAIYLGYEMASRGVDIRYLDLSEIQLLSAPTDLTKGHLSVDELVEWARDIKTETLLILDNSNLLESVMSNLLLQLYRATNFINLKVVVTTRRLLTVSEVPSQFFKKSFSHILKVLDTDSASSLLQNRTTVKLTEKECQALTHIAGNYPLVIKIIASLLNGDTSGDVAGVIGKLKRQRTEASLVPRDFLPPLWMSHDQMGVIGQGCARYLSMFPGSFDEEAAHQVLSSSGFSDPSYCLQALTKYSLIEQYTHYQQQRFKLPRVVRDFYAYVRRECHYSEYESTTFQRGFKKHYTQLFSPLTNNREDSRLLRVESHNIHFFRNIP